ncbi:hypothetical protein BV898_08091 [Hypsibius exemplaris]|uniref:Transmembrane protein 9 n=1 Tax=Hypsibius exemplaris TaxID=2072580 RepID=A0A1W0WRG1_HYPEX|nr:hypothetical protein BV898_08091 [Hypsibius exemplaris]
MSSYWSWIVIGVIICGLTASTAAVDKDPLSDKRCKCVCPRLNTTGRAVFIQNVAPEQCNCDYVVLRSLPYEGYQVKNAAEFCATCQCKHENRNSVTIKAVVILFIVVVALLIVYMVYLLIEARLCKGATKAMSEDSATSVAYEQHLDDEDYEVRSRSSMDNNGQRHGHSGLGLRARFNEQMTRWKRAVTQQRGNVYVRRTVLNN